MEFECSGLTIHDWEKPPDEFTTITAELDALKQRVRVSFDESSGSLVAEGEQGRLEGVVSGARSYRTDSGDDMLVPCDYEQRIVTWWFRNVAKNDAEAFMQAHFALREV